MNNKKAMILYYSYEDEEFVDLTLEEIGAICMGLLAIEKNKEIREDAFETIEKDRALKTIFREMSGKTKRATENWYATAEKYNRKIIYSTDNEKVIVKKENEFVFKKFEFEDFNFEFYCENEYIPKDKNKFITKVYDTINIYGKDALDTIWHQGNNEHWQKGWENYF